VLVAQIEGQTRYLGLRPNMGTDTICDMFAGSVPGDYFAAAFPPMHPPGP